jgi:hypothetical protein
METHNDIERQIQELERDKRLEEIKQLRAERRRAGSRPAFFIALLPLLGTFGLGIFEEFKQYNKGTQALAERDALRQEKDDLQGHIEVDALLQLKKHYVDESQRLERETALKQYVLNTTYLRSVYEMGEAKYALGLRAGERLDDNALEQLKADAKQLPAQSGDTFDRVLADYNHSEFVIGTALEIISKFESAMKLVPASDRTRALRYETGVLGSQKVLVLREGVETPRYYDVDKGRYLTKEESEGAR